MPLNQYLNPALRCWWSATQFPEYTMSDFGTFSSDALSTLAVGNIISASIIIDKADMVDPASKSGTARKWVSNLQGGILEAFCFYQVDWPTLCRIKAGNSVERFCIVLAATATSVTVTYLVTFDKATALPTTLDNNYWYPIKPATKEGTLEPLPALNTRAQWASLRKKQYITGATVSWLETSSVGGWFH